jgi:hypothetical protein
MEDAAAPPAAPDAPAAPKDASPPGPDAAEVRAGKLRLQAKVAGVMMMLFGAFFTFNFALAAYNSPHLTQTYAAAPGGNLTVAFPQAPGANVTLSYLSGAPATMGQLDGAGHGTFHASNATFTLRVTHQGATWTRQAFVPEGTPPELASLTLDPASPRDSPDRVGLPTEFAWLWPAALASALVVAGGYFAFKLRGPRLALGGAFLFIAGAAMLLSILGLQLLSLSFVGTAVLCFLFIYRARTQFLPFRTRPAP